MALTLLTCGKKSAATPTSSGSSPSPGPDSTNRRHSCRASDKWIESRRYMGLELIAKSRIRIVTTDPNLTSEPTMTAKH